MRKFKSAEHALCAIRRAVHIHRASYDVSFSRFVRLYRRDFSPYEIAYYDLLDPAFSDEVLEHIISRQELIELDKRNIVGSYLCLTSDKAVFYSVCRAAGLPIPELLAVFDRPRGWTCDGRSPQSAEDWHGVFERLPEHFVVKPALGLQGFGFAAYHREDDRLLRNDGRQRTPEELLEDLQAIGKQNLFAGGYSHHSLRLTAGSHKAIVQEQLRPHPEIAAMTGSSSLSTCRILTLVGDDGAPSILATAIRVIVGANATDNFVYGENGNLWASVDETAGRITEAFGLSPDGRRLERRRQHPTTGVELAAFRVPRWGEVKDLALRLALMFRPQRMVSWDIAVTDRNVAVIEGNVGGQMIPTPLNRPVRSLL
jgi:hypothetical protein